MRLLSKEHYDLMDRFEREFSGRMDREPKELWAKKRIYQNGEINDAFLAFRLGYAIGKTEGREEAS